MTADLFYIFTLSHSSRGGSYFVLSDKVCKTLFCANRPKVEPITAKVLLCLFFATISAHLFRYFQSVLIGDCFSFCSLL